MAYKAVLFDLDGTLLNTIDDLADSMNNVLKKMGFPQHSIESYKIFVGDGMETLAERSLPENKRDKKTVIECLTGMREEYGKNWAVKTRPYKGIPELLDFLERAEIKTAVLSNKPDDFTIVVVKKFLSKWHFDIVRGQKHGSPKKPDPTGALEIANELKISPPEFIYLGDTNTDMRTAVSAGMFPVGVLWGFRTTGEMIESGAKLLIKKPVEIFRFFK